MASPKPSLKGIPKPSSILPDKLASVLPKGQDFGIYHLSTPPTKNDALHNPPPGVRPDKTYCEQHFLAVTIPSSTSSTAPSSPSLQASSKRSEVLVLAIEIYIFTTAYSSTFFVSKADSTGYLSLLKLPRGTPSPIREVTAAFISHILEHRRRKDIQSIINLFARAQDQYLFPGSIKNKDKHVLDDRGLVKWWCRVLDPLLAPREPMSGTKERRKGAGYLIVPGMEDHDTRAFIPRTPSSNGFRWALGHPLESISHYCQEYDWVPPRCLIPKYPDDPKARYRDELDEQETSKKDLGAWKNVKSLEQFWEMMAYRQECSSGRLTGFIWVVFGEQGIVAPLQAQNPESGIITPNVSFSGSQELQPPTTPPRRTAAVETATPKATPNKKHTNPKPKKKKPLRGLIIPRQPRVKRQQRESLNQPPKTTAYYHWPLEGRGTKIVDEDGYKRSVELLLHLDFATLEKAIVSTARWVAEVGTGRDWKMEVKGLSEAVISAKPEAVAQVNNLSSMVKRKRDPEAKAETVENGKPVNVLGPGSVRNKRKSDEVDAPDAAPEETTKANDLEPGLVRKKPRPV